MPNSRCWQVLALSPEADERSIKRQYAKLLKVTRPDEDPVAFQRLREAYEQALQSVREALTETSHRQRCTPKDRTALQTSAPSPHTQAIALLETFDDRAIERTWNEATARGIERSLEPLLLRHCLKAGAACPNLLRWGLEERQWLTPWQAFQHSDLEQRHLSSQLTMALHAKLEHYLAAGEYAHFVDCLTQASRQGWLGELSRRQTLQVHVLTLLMDNQDWPPSLFEDICRLFAWDLPGAAPPIADEHWQALHRRCEQRARLTKLHTLADRRKQAPSPEANAAALFLQVRQPDRQKALAAGFGEADWQACEQLSDTFATRFADLLGLFPMHDPWFWKQLIEQRRSPHEIKRAAATLTMALALQSLPGGGLAVMLIMLPLYALGGLLGAKVGQWLLGLWYVASSLQDLDLRVTAWCARKGIIRDRRYPVIRTVGPRVALGLVIWSWLGVLGLFTAVFTGIIGVLQPTGLAPQHSEYRWRKPLQAIYRIAGLSGLQWVFCAAMIVVIGYVRVQGGGG